MKNLYCIIFLFVFSFSTDAQEVVEISREWTSFSQFLDIESNKSKKFKVRASIKIETVDKAAWIGIWARVDNKDNEIGFFDNMDNRAVKSNIWQSYEINGIIDENSERLNFGGLCMRNGKFYFDNFELYIENDTGEFERVKIDNPDFENTVANNNIPKWSQGIEKGRVIKVKQYDVFASEDALSGNFSLLIQGSDIPESTSGTIGNIEGTSPQIGAMISMLENLKSRVVNTVSGLSQYQLDYLHDAEANRIGSLIMHLAAAEKFYQVFTFEGRGFNDEEMKIWNDALKLDQGGRDNIKGKSIQYYLDIYDKVRAKTIEELKKRDDKWFEEIQPSDTRSNHYCWFHVMEHQSSHLGQILFLMKRIPPNPELTIDNKIKD